MKKLSKNELLKAKLLPARIMKERMLLRKILPGFVMLTVLLWNSQAQASHPKFYATNSADVSALITKSQDSSTSNVFNKSSKSIADVIKSQADDYLAERGFRYLNYTILYPYLQPFPHNPNCKSLHVGTATSAAAWARWALPGAVSGAYTIEFEYRYDTASQQDGFYVFSSYNGSAYTVARLTQTGTALSAHDQTNVATLAEKTWYHIAIDVDSSAGTYNLYLNGQPIRQNGTLLSNNGTLSAIGFLGDISTVCYSGQGWWDNFRISAGATTLNKDYIDNTLSNWTVYDPVEQSSIIPHDNLGLDAYPYWTGVGSNIQQRLDISAIAYLLTNDSKYLNYCKATLLSACGNGWDTWTDADYSSTPALVEPYMCVGASYAYDTIFSSLNASEKSAVQNGILNRGMLPIHQVINSLDIMQNVNIAEISGLGIGALALGDELNMDTYLNEVRGKMNDICDAADIDGGWYEGFCYGDLALNYVSNFYFHDARINNSNAWTQQPYLGRIAQFCYQSLSPDASSYINFCDSYSLNPYYQMPLAAIYNRLSDPFAINMLAKTGWLQNTPMGFVLFPAVSSLPSLGDVSSGWNFREIGWNMARSDWGANALMVATHAGPKVGHSHLDENNLVICKGGTWFGADPGYQVYQAGPAHNYTYGTAGHNCLMVGSSDQANIAGDIQGFYSDSRFAYSAGDAVAAYPNQLTTAFRKIVLDKQHESVLVFDKYAKASGVTDPVRFMLHSECDSFSVSTQSHATAAKGSYQMDLRVLNPSSPATTCNLDLYGGYIYSHLLVNIPDSQLSHAWQVSITYYSGAGGALQQYFSSGYVTIGAITGGESWRTDTYNVGTPYLDYCGQSGANVLFGFSAPVLVRTITARDVTTGQTYTVNAGSATDQDISANTPGTCFYPAWWKPAMTYGGYTVRSNLGRIAFDIQDSANPSSGIFLNSICTSAANAPVYFACGSEHNVIITGQDNNASVIKLTDDLTSMVTEFLAADDTCQAGASTDNSVAAHSPGICFYPNSEWNAPSTDGSFTVRTAPAGDANFYLNVATGETAAYRIAIVYKASSSGALYQYMPDPDGYLAVAQIRGDGQYNTLFCYARPPYRDLNGAGSNGLVNVLFDFSVPVTVATMYAERCAETDFCDVGAPLDNDVSTHSPGICVYPDVWGAPALYGSYTARAASQSSACLYVNINATDTNRLHYVELTYVASSNVQLSQYTNSADNNGYKVLATLVGDGTVRKVMAPLDRDYRDYNGRNSNDLVNVLLTFSAPITLIDAAVTGNGIVK
jgi:hypothetical protein